MEQNNFDKISRGRSNPHVGETIGETISFTALNQFFDIWWMLMDGTLDMWLIDWLEFADEEHGADLPTLQLIDIDPAK